MEAERPASGMMTSLDLSRRGLLFCGLCAMVAVAAALALLSLWS